MAEILLREKRREQLYIHSAALLTFAQSRLANGAIPKQFLAASASTPTRDGRGAPDTLAEVTECLVLEVATLLTLQVARVAGRATRSQRGTETRSRTGAAILAQPSLRRTRQETPRPSRAPLVYWLAAVRKTTPTFSWHRLLAGPWVFLLLFPVPSRTRNRLTNHSRGREATPPTCLLRINGIARLAPCFRPRETVSYSPAFGMKGSAGKLGHSPTCSPKPPHGVNSLALFSKITCLAERERFGHFRNPVETQAAWPSVKDTVVQGCQTRGPWAACVTCWPPPPPF
ncbi:hypothetical protein L345_01245, partial [Ophiophagus hannah]